MESELYFRQKWRMICVRGESALLTEKPLQSCKKSLGVSDVWLGVGMDYATNYTLNSSMAYVKEAQDGMRQATACGLEICLLKHISEGGNTENEGY